MTDGKNCLTRVLCLFLAAIVPNVAAPSAFTPSACAENVIYPGGVGIVNVKNWSTAANNAVGDGVTDDTARIQAAINANLGQSKILYFPTGTYRLTNKLTFGSNISNAKRLVLQGQSRDGTVFKLDNGAAGYGDANAPKPLLTMWEGASHYDGFLNAIQNLTLDTGANNPGAIGVVFMGHNVSGMRDVRIKTSDASYRGVRGLDLTGSWPGPALFKNLEIVGFSDGVATNQGQYSATFENLTLKFQNRVGMSIAKNAVTIRNLTSQNARTAIRVEDGEAHLVLIGATLSGGATSVAGGAIFNKGRILLRGVSRSGYTMLVDNDGNGYADVSATGTGSLANGEYLSNAVQQLFPSTQRTLQLPVEETPEVAWDEPNNWQKITPVSGDDTATIQAAFDFAANNAKTTVCFASGTYEISDTIRIWGGVRRVIGLYATIAPTSALRNSATFKPAFRLEQSAPVLLIEQLQTQQVFDANNVPGAGFVWFHHNTSNTVAFRQIYAPPFAKFYTHTPTGKVFFEDVAMLGARSGPNATLTSAPLCELKAGHKAWARQFNPESDNEMVRNAGGTFWCLGLKTEGWGTAIHTNNGGKTELLGGFITPRPDGIAVPAGVGPLFVVNGAQATFSFTAHGQKYPIYIRETRGTETRNTTTNWRNITLFSAWGTGTTTATQTVSGVSF